MEYWAVVWGTIIMGVTGLMIWFKMDVTQVPAALGGGCGATIHYYEAILACLAIVVWHFYHVIFDPDVYPLNWACWNGKVSEALAGGRASARRDHGRQVRSVSSTSAGSVREDTGGRE